MIVLNYDYSIKEMVSEVPKPEYSRKKKLSNKTIERNNMDYEAEQLKRIADAIEEILRLVKKDMEPRTKEKD